jgi:hypothetical protein
MQAHAAAVALLARVADDAAADAPDALPALLAVCSYALLARRDDLLTCDDELARAFKRLLPVMHEDKLPPDTPPVVRGARALCSGVTTTDATTPRAHRQLNKMCGALTLRARAQRTWPASWRA